MTWATGSIASPNFPEQWTILRENPSLIRLAFEEVLRFEAPVQTSFRTIIRDVEVAGTRPGEGEKVLPFLAAANRVGAFERTAEPGQRLNNTLRGLDGLRLRIVAA
ncbi:MAG: hypothetical protein JOY90_38845 [Bradyrhizobium sp.]|uniref:hypothetical protein n=1 Tax=Bradyrhizobium sp. TaxID=376 RepID=UPI001D28FA5B|nr:hypothetical protein [Bradyrhizobium sp.]MBV9566360.1 hypothetical protein [Bradyrhizobium sp.]